MWLTLAIVAFIVCAAVLYCALTVLAHWPVDTKGSAKPEDFDCHP